jgi:hypothetical protein
MSDWCPLCVRFKPADLKAIRLAAHREGIEPTIWIREVVLSRVAAVLNGEKVQALKFDTAHTSDASHSQLCVRFADRDYTQVRRAAMKDAKALPSSWVRAVAVQRAVGLAVRRTPPKGIGVTR